MSNYLEPGPQAAVAQAVATIVSSCFGSVLSKATGVPDKERDALEQRVINFADQLTRTLAKALIAEHGDER